ncbi:MAG: hypothetical protein Q4G25_12735 [Paracoccus sp. (in: a-proteobacteria)]|nr:hypothetical protein [Paracoccus sp. (in: a-proteobacteria)]
MTILDLQVADQLWHGGERMAAAWMGGRRVWAVPRPLGAYAGVGPGQIPMDLRFWEASDRTMSGSTITALTNRGGAGAAFNLSGADGPVLDDGAARFAGGKALGFSVTPDIDGVHFLIAIKPTVTGANTNKFVAPGISNGGVYYTERSLTILDWRYYFGGSGPTVRINTPLDAWHIGEVRITDGEAALIWDGSVRHTVAETRTGLSITGLGSPASLFQGYIGGLISVICAPGRSAAMPEPAVLLARQVLASKYGVSLT